MNKLIDFIIAHKHWFLWLVLQAIALLLLMNDGLYRRSVSIYATNMAVGHLNEWMTEGRSYLDLRRKNELLLQEKARLEHDYIALKRAVSDAQAEGNLPDSLLYNLQGITRREVVTARIVNLVNRTGDLYYIINRGEQDGIRADMAVMSEHGVMGTVMQASKHYAVVIPVINSKLKLSCSLKGKEYRGTLSAQGLNAPVILGGLPLHAEVEAGDTVQTSGYSYVYPEGLMVGIVEQSDTEGVEGAETAFGTYRIRLATDFERLSYVYVLLAPPMSEAQELEKTALPDE